MRPSGIITRSISRRSACGSSANSSACGRSARSIDCVAMGSSCALARTSTAPPDVDLHAVRDAVLAQQVELRQPQLQRVEAEDVRRHVVQVRALLRRGGRPRAECRTSRRACWSAWANSNRLGPMMQIHPVPAFEDNYLWVIEDGRHAAVVDPGDEHPVQAFLESRGLTLTAILVDPPPRRPRGRRWSGWRAAGSARSSVRPARRSTGSRRGCARATGSRCPGSDLELEVLDVPGHTRGPHRLLSGADVAVLRRHPLRLRLRPALRGHARADAGFPRQARGAARRHPRVLRPRVHDVEHPLRARRRARQREARRPQRARRGRPRRRPPDAALHHRRRARDQPLPALGLARRSSPRPRGTPAARSPRPSRCSRPCANGRTTSAEARSRSDPP